MASGQFGFSGLLLQPRAPRWNVPGDAGGDRLHCPPPRVLYPVRRGVPPSHPGDGYCPSIVDLYEKGISVSSMSKVFSLAGIRLGWIASRDPEVLERCLIHRDYDLISCGLLDETVAALA